MVNFDFKEFIYNSLNEYYPNTYGSEEGDYPRTLGQASLRYGSDFINNAFSGLSSGVAAGLKMADPGPIKLVDLDTMRNLYLKAINPDYGLTEDDDGNKFYLFFLMEVGQRWTENRKATMARNIAVSYIEHMKLDKYYGINDLNDIKASVQSSHGGILYEVMVYLNSQNKGSSRPDAQYKYRSKIKQTLNNLQNANTTNATTTNANTTNATTTNANTTNATTTNANTTNATPNVVATP